MRKCGSALVISGALGVVCVQVMAAAAAPAAPQGSCSTDSLGVGVWSRVDVEAGAGPGEDTFHRQPCQRSLHVAAVLKDNLLVFGGYDGSNRCVLCVCMNMAASSKCAAHSHARYRRVVPLM